MTDPIEIEIACFFNLLQRRQDWAVQLQHRKDWECSW